MAQTGSRQGGGVRSRKKTKGQAVPLPVESRGDNEPLGISCEFTPTIAEAKKPATKEEIEAAYKENRKYKGTKFIEAPEGVELKKTRLGAEYYMLNGETIFVAGGWMRCPRCGALDTLLVKNHFVMNCDDRAYTQEYRRCRRVICRKTFKAFRPN